MLQQARVVPTSRQRALLHLNTAGHLRGGCGSSEELLAASDAAVAVRTEEEVTEEQKGGESSSEEEEDGSSMDEDEDEDQDDARIRNLARAEAEGIEDGVEGSAVEGVRTQFQAALGNLLGVPVPSEDGKFQAAFGIPVPSAKAASVVNAIMTAVCTLVVATAQSFYRYRGMPPPNYAFTCC